MNKLLFCGALLGLLSVMMAAYVDHVLAAKLSEHALHSVATAQRLQQFYALVVAVIGLVLTIKPSRLLGVAGFVFLAGTLCFCFGVYGAILLGWAAVMKVVPVGGFLLMLGWVLLAGCGFRVGLGRG